MSVIGGDPNWRENINPMDVDEEKMEKFLGGAPELKKTVSVQDMLNGRVSKEPEADPLKEILGED